METIDRIPSYSDIFAVGHKAAAEIFNGEVTVEEKVDGSQISFGKYGGNVLMRSKGKQIVLDAPDKMFSKAVAVVQGLADHLQDGWTYRGEYLMSPKHNTRAYSRTPAQNIIIYDIDKGLQDYLGYEAKSLCAAELGFETVPLLFRGRIETGDQMKALFPKESILGNATPEGIVIKNYERFADDKKVLMAKYVSEAFKETNGVEWKKAKPNWSDIILLLIAEHRNEARWAKAVQHLRDSGKLTQTPADIGNLIREAQADIEKECADTIKEKLFAWAHPKIQRGAVAGLPEWYKNHLLEGK